MVSGSGRSSSSISKSKELEVTLGRTREVDEGGDGGGKGFELASGLPLRFLVLIFVDLVGLIVDLNGEVLDPFRIGGFPSLLYPAGILFLFF